MPLLFSPTQRGLSDLKAGEACQKQAEAVPEKPATSRLFNAFLKATLVVPLTCPVRNIAICECVLTRQQMPTLRAITTYT